MNIFKKYDIKVTDSFLEKFANRYINQRSDSTHVYNVVNNNILISRTGFDATKLQAIITKNVITEEFVLKPNGSIDALRNIYRSDLGEMMLTYFFEEKLAETDQYVIPLKNITYRELSNIPGRGLDAIGYRIEDGEVIRILIGEAKVSDQKSNPPGVVDANKDSMYNSQLSHKNNITVIEKKLSDYCKRLNSDHATNIGSAILAMSLGLTDMYDLTFGCCLLRDHLCVDDTKDFGKFRSSTEFDPYQVYFPILSFNKTIEDTVTLFYDKVKEVLSVGEDE